jgi:hypothetical protein
MMMTMVVMMMMMVVVMMVRGLPQRQKEYFIIEHSGQLRVRKTAGRLLVITSSVSKD